jgi:hypothetical protein
MSLQGGTNFNHGQIGFRGHLKSNLLGTRTGDHISIGNMG